MTDHRLRMLFAITHLGYWMPLEPVAQYFCDNGSTVKLLLDKNNHQKQTRHFIFDAQKTPYAVGWMKSRRDIYRFILPLTREVISYAAYIRLRHPTSLLLTERWAGFLPRFLRRYARSEKGRKWLSSDKVWEALRRFETAAPASDRICRELKAFSPNVVVAASAIMPFSKETEYLKSARHLGIPSVVIVPSWDNLTTKGTLANMPDWMFVWNKGQVKEATDLHGVPRERIFCTGAPKYDSWFNLKPVMDRDAFCQRVRLSQNRRYLLYICSSGFIARDESKFVDELADDISRRPELKDVTLLVRPHPANTQVWENYKTRHDNVVLWPKDVTVINSTDAAQDFYHSIYYSECVIGINTSAFIESAIVDRPCIAVASDQYQLTQMGIPHFQHLLDAMFLELPRDFHETSNIITALLDGRDDKKKMRREFVRNFIRPHGLELSATEVMTRALEKVARGLPPGI